jgi:hypothetical protein
MKRPIGTLFVAFVAVFVIGGLDVLGQVNETPGTREVCAWLPQFGVFDGGSHVMGPAMRRQGYDSMVLYLGDDERPEAEMTTTKVEVFRDLMLRGVNLWYCGHGNRTHEGGIMIECCGPGDNENQAFLRIEELAGRTIFDERGEEVHPYDRQYLYVASGIGTAGRTYYGVGVRWPLIARWRAEALQSRPDTKPIMYIASCWSAMGLTSCKAGLAIGYLDRSHDAMKQGDTAMLFGLMAPEAHARTDCRSSGMAFAVLLRSRPKSKLVTAGSIASTMVLAPTVARIGLLFHPLQ